MKTFRRVLLALTAATALFLAPQVALGSPGGRGTLPSPSVSSSPKPPVVPRTTGILTGFDSITVGATGSVTDSYRGPLTSLLDGAAFGHRFIVAAESGSRCTQWVDQMPELLSWHNPGVVIINCGTNDPTFTVEDRELLGQSYRQLIETIHAHNPHTRIMLSLIQISTVDPEGSLAWLPDNEIRANEVIAFNAEYYIPAWPTVTLVDLSTIPTTVENNPDGIHLSPLGEQKYAQAYFDEGRRLGWW